MAESSTKILGAPLGDACGVLSWGFPSLARLIRMAYIRLSRGNFSSRCRKIVEFFFLLGSLCSSFSSKWDTATPQRCRTPTMGRDLHPLAFLFTCIFSWWMSGYNIKFHSPKQYLISILLSERFGTVQLCNCRPR